MTKSVSTPSPKRSVTWFSWPEIKGLADAWGQELAPYEAEGWRAASRISITKRVDGSATVIIPMRKGKTRQTVTLSWGPDKPKGKRK